MKRKDFLKAACGMGLAGGTAALKIPAAQTEPAKEEKARDMFKETWVLTLMENMEKDVDSATRERLMNDCGRACARRSGLLKTAEKFRGDMAGFIQTLGPQVGKDLCRLEGETVHWGYPRCYCELVADGPERLPESYCLCSAGWVLEVFEIVADRRVRVEVVQTIKRGAPDCRFIIHL
jgi:hypothetical protein